MVKCIGMLEFRSITEGLQAADKMVKTARLIFYRCFGMPPGKLLLLSPVMSVRKKCHRCWQNSASDGIMMNFIS